jgi:hypothetical protein
MPLKSKKVPNFWMYNAQRPARHAVKSLSSLLGGLNTKRKKLNKKIKKGARKGYKGVRKRYNRFAGKWNAFKEGK